MKIDVKDKRFLTIRQFCRIHGLSETLVRSRVADGTCPGLHSGNRFMVNVPLFLDILDKESMRAKA